jgi:hypothetical protein
MGPFWPEGELRARPLPSAVAAGAKRSGGCCPASRVVGRGASPQPHLLAVLAGNETVAVELDLVQPARPGRWPLSESGLAGKDEAERP